MWFEQLVGFEEFSPKNVREKIVIDGKNLISKVNGKSFQCGTLEVPTLKQLKDQSLLEQYNDKVRIKELIANVRDLHCDPQNRHALFQAASQFNLLEMMNPNISPENGVGIYEQDYTQGPACAIACGAGTIYRNYFVPVRGQIGQTTEHQIDCLELLGTVLGNHDSCLWEMENGYALVRQDGLLSINSYISNLDFEQREQLKEKLKIGLQWDTEVTLTEAKHVVSQAYCSALPVAYSAVDSLYWEPFARLILEATYEATLHAALINFEKTACDKVFLTLVGAGVFGNKIDWVMDSIKMAITKFLTTPLDIKIISYGSSNRAVLELLKVLKI